MEHKDQTGERTKKPYDYDEAQPRHKKTRHIGALSKK